MDSRFLPTEKMRKDANTTHKCKERGLVRNWPAYNATQIDAGELAM
ncbi:hypothetical protein [Burkholderia sp. Bp8963]|nr:hypothetical protein [Burkholderia sp. Bp8963]